MGFHQVLQSVFKKAFQMELQGEFTLHAIGDLFKPECTTPLSDKISRELKKMGFKFVGSTIIYSFMQATGMVNDHVKDCFVYQELAKE